MDETVRTILTVGATVILTLIIGYFWNKGPGTDYVTKTEWDKVDPVARKEWQTSVVARQAAAIEECNRRRSGCKGSTDIDCLKKAVLMLVKYSDKIPEDKKDSIMKDMVE